MKIGSHSFSFALNNMLGLFNPELKNFRLRTAFVSLEVGKILELEKVKLDALISKSLSIDETVKKEVFNLNSLTEEVVYASAVAVEPLKNRRVCIFSKDLVVKQLQK